MATRLSPRDLELPVVSAPLAGGPSTPALAAAVSDAGGLGMLAAGYRAPDAVAAELDALRAATPRPFGVNLFAPPGPAADRGVVARYAARLAPEATRAGVPLGEPRHDDDAYAAKLDLLAAAAPAVVSFAFGCPAPGVVARLQDRGSAVWVTVTTPAEAAAAARAGADALVVQGVEAGGHRGGFDDAAPGDFGLLVLLQLVAAEVDLPLVASGGIATGRGLAAVLAAGAAAAQLGTALLLTPEAATSAPHRAALAGRDADRADAGLHRPAGARAWSTGSCASTTTRRAPTRRSTTSPRPCARPRAGPATPRRSTSGPARRTRSPARSRPGRSRVG